MSKFWKLLYLTASTLEKRSLNLNALTASLAFLLGLAWPVHALTVEGPTWVDYGSVHNARILRHEFVLTNTHSAPCQILEVTPDCERCTLVELSDDYVAPGESVLLTVKLLTDSLLGSVRKGVQLKMDVGTPQIEVGLSAKVEPRFEYANEDGFIMQLRGPGVKRGRFELIDMKKADWSAVKSETFVEWVDATAKIDGVASNLIQVVADVETAFLVSGLHYADLSFESHGERIEIPLKAFVEKDFVITPETLSFKAVKGVQRQIIHYKANRTELYIKRVHAPAAHFKVMVKPDYAVGEYRIYIYGSNLEAYSLNDSQLRIETLDQTLEAIELPILVRP